MKSSNLSSLSLLGRAVKSRRYELGYSQEELAWRAGLHRTYVTDVERGARNVSLNTIDKLAGALEISLTSLFGAVDRARGIDGLAADRPAQVDILLVEDDRNDLDLTLRALRLARLSNKIHVTRDGKEALDFLFASGSLIGRQSNPLPHLVLLDLKLPKVGGLEVLRRCKTNERTSSIPIVVLTGSSDGRDLTTARQLGAEGYIVKPVNFQRLSAVTPTLNFSWELQRSKTPSAV